MHRPEPLVDASHLIGDRDALRRRFAEDGYLYFRDLLKRDVVLDVRACMLEKLAEEGWLDPNADSGLARPGPVARHEGSAEFWSGYIAVQRLETFHRLAHDDRLRTLAQRLLGDDVFVHPQKIARVSFPSTTFFTAPHQDYRYIQATQNFVTMWIPVGDCSVEHGGLRLVPRSHLDGLLPVSAAPGAGGLAVDVGDDASWHGADYTAGDVVVFGSLTVHGALPNLTDRLRLSVDYRYQSASEPIARPSLGPHFAGHPEMPGLDELSRGWASRRWCDYPAAVDVVDFANPTDDFVLA